MLIACKYAASMKKNIQIRSVSPELHQKLKIKATISGKTLTEFLLNELKAIAERPTVSELQARLSLRSPVRTKMSATKVLRLERLKS